jgi:hypothetical protein
MVIIQFHAKLVILDTQKTCGITICVTRLLTVILVVNPTLYTLHHF